MTDDLEAYFSIKTKKVRHELRRKNRKIQKDFQTHLRHFEDMAELSELFQMIQDIETDTWKFRAGSAIISSLMEQNFYKDVFKTFSALTHAKAYILYVNSIPISYVFGVAFEGTFYTLKTSYKESYAQYAPGIVLFLQVLEKLFSKNEGLSKIELLGKDARWKKELSTDGKTFCTYALYPSGLYSYAYTRAYKYLKPSIDNLLNRSEIFANFTKKLGYEKKN